MASNWAGDFFGKASNLAGDFLGIASNLARDILKLLPILAAIFWALPHTLAAINGGCPSILVRQSASIFMSTCLNDREPCGLPASEHYIMTVRQWIKKSIQTPTLHHRRELAGGRGGWGRTNNWHPAKPICGKTQVNHPPRRTKESG